MNVNFFDRILEKFIVTKKEPIPYIKLFYIPLIPYFVVIYGIYIYIIIQ